MNCVLLLQHLQTKRICTTYVDPSSLIAYTSCRLVPLDKCPGVRPVGIGEVVRRIVGKAVMKVVKRISKRSLVLFSCVQDKMLDVKRHSMLWNISMLEMTQK